MYVFIGVFIYVDLVHISCACMYSFLLGKHARSAISELLERVYNISIRHNGEYKRAKYKQQ